MCEGGWLSSREKQPFNEIKPSKRLKRNRTKGRELEPKGLEPKQVESKELEPKQVESKTKKRQRMDEDSKDDVMDSNNRDKRPAGGGISVFDTLMETTNRLDQLKKLAEPVIEMTDEMKRIRAKIKGDKGIDKLLFVVVIVYCTCRGVCHFIK